MADTKHKRGHDTRSAPRPPPAREHDLEHDVEHELEHKRAPRVPRPVPDFDEVSADDELGSDENQLHQRRVSPCDEED